MRRLVFASLLIVVLLVSAACAAPAATTAPAAAPTTAPAAAPTTAPAEAPTSAPAPTMAAAATEAAPAATEAAPAATEAAPAATGAPAATSATAATAPAAAATGGQAYTMAQGDTLATVAEKQLGNKDWLWAIYGATNQKHIEDSSFTQITNPDQVAAGAKIWVPTKDEAQAFMAKFDPKNPDIHMLFPKPASGQLLVGNWWTSGGEFAGINALYQMYKKMYPGVDVVHAGIAGGGGVNFQAANLTKLQSGDPFDVFQTHAGAEIARYSPEQYLTPLEDLLNQTEGSVVPQDVKNLLQYKGHIYSLPLNIHRGNVLWVNKKVLADNGLQAPTTFDEFFKVADALKAKGIVPLAMGGSGGLEGPQAFETVLLGTVGPDAMINLAQCKMSWKDPKIADALNTYKKYLTYTNTDRDSLSWDQAVKLVIEGKAAMNIMGDWADGEFKVAGKTAADYEGIPAPGDKGSFLLVSDTFAMPLKAPNKDNAINWLKLIATKDAQEAFNINKGSICVRTDCDYSKFDDYLKSSAADFKTSRIVPGIVYAGAALPPDWRQAFLDTIIKFNVDGDVQAAQNSLVQAAMDAGCTNQ